MSLGSKIIYYIDEVSRLASGEPVFPVTMEVDPSNFCQNDCVFCFVRDYLDRFPVFMDVSVFRRAASEFRDGGGRSITFTGGGEPLTHPRFNDMVEHALSLGLKIGLVTNGIYLDRVLPLLNRFTFVRASVSASTPETYAAVHRSDNFGRIIENLKECLSVRKQGTGPTIGVGYVVFEGTRKETDKFPDIGLDYLQFRPEIRRGVPALSVDSNFERKIETSRIRPDSAVPCAIAGLVAVLGANGRLYYCCQKRGVDSYCIGDVAGGDSLVDAFVGRVRVRADVRPCPFCRYMNYVPDYLEYSKPQYSFLRHRDFL